MAHIRDLLEEISAWLDEGVAFAVARVVGVEGSGPRAPGAAMVVSGDGRVAGSVSGGCVEGAVVTEALAALEDGQPRLVRFGYSDDEAFAVGLTCGGVISLFITPGVPGPFPALRAAIGAGDPVGLATVVSIEACAPGEIDEANCIEPGSVVSLEGALGASLLVRDDSLAEGSSGDAGLDRVLARDGAGLLAAGRSELRHYGVHAAAGELRVGVFFETFAPAPRMLVFGAVDFSAALARMGKLLGYHVTVCDARATFATPERFPMADEVVVDWPHRYLETVGDRLGRRDAICVLTHDPKFDVPALKSALGTGAGYVGAMGSRRTNAERARRLAEAGVAQADIARVHGPIGLDLGARTPEETAVAICAEIIAVQTGHSPASLKDGTGPIHGLVGAGARSA